MSLNELVIKRTKEADFFDPETRRLVARATQVEDPTLNISTESDDVVDAQGSKIGTIFKAKNASYSASNSLFSLDIFNLQVAGKKSEGKTSSPIAEILEATDGKLTLTEKPTNEIKYIYPLINGGVSTPLEKAAAVADGKFTSDGNTITLPNGATGKYWVEYEYEAEEGTTVDVASDTFPEVFAVKILTLFADPCNFNKVKAGWIVSENAQFDASSVDITLTPTGKHGWKINFNKPYCDEDSKLFSVIIPE